MTGSVWTELSPSWIRHFVLVVDVLEEVEVVEAEEEEAEDVVAMTPLLDCAVRQRRKRRPSGTTATPSSSLDDELLLSLERESSLKLEMERANISTQLYRGS